MGTKYRVGLMVKGHPRQLWLRTEPTKKNDPIDLHAFGGDPESADLYNPKMAMSWVQLLAKRFPTALVLVERVEVAHG